jgi:radical SAM superfamily enzyme YgiQ (UPF0313 family)
MYRLARNLSLPGGVVLSMETLTSAPVARILLVYPEIPDTYWSYRHALEFVGKKALMPPLGLLTVAAILGEEFDYRLIDMNVESLEESAISWCDYVFVSAMIVQAESLHEVIARCNAAGKAVVAGGPYPTSCHTEIDGVDQFVLGEGECTIPDLRRDLIAGTPKPLYRAGERPAIDAVPVPRFDLCAIDLYDSMPLQFSRGCPFDCEFCDIVSLFGHRVRTKSAEQFTNEMTAIHESGFRGNVFVVDDNFIGNRRRVKELLRAIAAWQERYGYPFNLSTEASIDLADDPELLALMVAGGFTMVFVGLETPVGASLEETGKRQNTRGDMVERVRRIQSAGIEVTAGFIVGFDSDPEDIADRQIEFIQELGVPTAMVGLLTALPNTRLWDRLSSEGRMRFRSGGNNTHTNELNFVPKLPERTLIEGYRRILQTIYSPRRYFSRALALTKTLPRRSALRIRRRASRITRAQVRALVLSLFRQGFSRYAVWYWLFLIRSVLRRPRKFVASVTLAVRGHHFFVITEALMKTAPPAVGERTTEPSHGTLTVEV